MLSWIRDRRMAGGDAETWPGTPGRMQAAIREWMRLYNGETPQDVVSLGLGGLIAREIARLATLEMDIRVDGDDAEDVYGGRAAKLAAVMQEACADVRTAVELAAAGGTTILKPYVQGEALRVQTVRPGMFDGCEAGPDGRITGCTFFDRQTEGGESYLRAERHRMDGADVVITNRAYRGGEVIEAREVPLGTVPAWAHLARETMIPGAGRPLFAVLRMPFANTIDPDSPLGVSVYARAGGLMEAADRQFGRLLWEMESGERALYVDMRALTADGTDGGVLPMKRLYRTLDADPSGETLFQAWSPPLRVEAQLQALNAVLQRVEDACGLSRGTISDLPEGVRTARTATELKMTRQRTQALVRDVQKALEQTLYALCEALDTWLDALGAAAGRWRLRLTFDDGVVMDRAEAFAERIALVEKGAMAAEELRAWYLGDGGE